MKTHHLRLAFSGALLLAAACSDEPKPAGESEADWRILHKQWRVLHSRGRAATSKIGHMSDGKYRFSIDIASLKSECN